MPTAIEHLSSALTLGVAQGTLIGTETLWTPGPPRGSCPSLRMVTPVRVAARPGHRGIIRMSLASERRLLGTHSRALAVSDRL